MFFRLIKRYFTLLILPLFHSLLYFGETRTISGTLLWEFASFVGVSSLCALELLRCRFEVTGSTLLMRRGIFFAHKSAIGRGEITAIHSDANPALRLFHARDVSLNARAGRIKSKECRLVIRRRDYAALVDWFRETKNNTSQQNDNTNKQKYQCFGVKRVMTGLLYSSSLTAGLLAAAPTVTLLGKVVGQSLEQRFLHTVNQTAQRLDWLVPKVGGVMALLLLAAFLLSFTVGMLRRLNFSVSKTGGFYEIASGVFNRKTAIIRESSVTGMVTGRNILLRLFRLEVCFLVVSGARGDGAAFFPAVTPLERKLLTGSLLPDEESAGYEKLKPPCRAKKRFVFLPLVFLILVPITAAPPILLFPDFLRLALFFSAILELWLTIRLVLGLWAYKETGAVLEEQICIKGMRGSRMNNAQILPRQAAVIIISQNCFERSLRVCSLTVFTNTERGGTFTAKNLDGFRVFEAVNNLIGMNDSGNFRER
jgi:uncharacterized membrane protein YdbT with pleckstrin-like domain